MATSHAVAGIPFDLRPAGESLSDARSIAVVKNEAFETIRLVIPKNHAMPSHQVKGAITIYCIEGEVEFTAGGHRHPLRAGQWIFLEGNEPHSVVGVEDAALLLTIIFP